VLSLILIYAGGVIMGWGVKRLRAVREEDIIGISEDIGVLKKEKANEPEKPRWLTWTNPIMQDPES
jgi:hypothetical protein